jgi:hypothetical protein
MSERTLMETGQADREGELFLLLGLVDSGWQGETDSNAQGLVEEDLDGDGVSRWRIG